MNYYQPQPQKKRGQALGCMVTLIIVMVVGMIVWSIALKVMHSAGSTENGKVGLTLAMQQVMAKGVSHFHKDTGVYPDSLTDLVASSDSGLATKVSPGTYHGPYIIGVTDLIDGTHLPSNPQVDKHDTVIEHHWSYDKTTGAVSSAIPTNVVPKVSVPTGVKNALPKLPIPKDVNNLLTQ